MKKNIYLLLSFCLFPLLTYGINVSPELIKKAESGDAQAQIELGIKYIEEDNEQDKIKGFQLFEKAAKQGDLDAQRGLGSFYFGGVGTARNIKEAEKWFSKSQNRDGGKTEYTLAMLYLLSDKPYKNVEKGLALLKKVADGHFDLSVRAQKELGLFYLKGDGVEPNRELGFSYLEKAANSGDRQAQEQSCMFSLYYLKASESEANIESALQHCDKLKGDGSQMGDFILETLTSVKEGKSPKETEAMIQKWCDAGLSNVCESLEKERKRIKKPWYIERLWNVWDIVYRIVLVICAWGFFLQIRGWFKKRKKQDKEH